MMRSLAFILLLLPSVFADYNPQPSPTTKPTPTRLFTVAAFVSPFPPGNGTLTGLTMRAQGGSFWLNGQNPKPSTACGDARIECPPGNETVLWVDRWGGAWLHSTTPQQVYIDTQTGTLSYLTPATTPPSAFAPGAMIANFLHLGQGTAVFVPILDGAVFVNVGPGSFQWIGSDNSYWFACPRSGMGYQVMKSVGGMENWDKCISGVQLVALDYAGVRPAAGVYL